MSYDLWIYISSFRKKFQDLQRNSLEFLPPTLFLEFLWKKKKNLGTVNIGNNGLWFNSSQEAQPLQKETTKILNKKHSTREEKNTYYLLAT